MCWPICARRRRIVEEIDRLWMAVVSLWRTFTGTGAHCCASPTRARIRNRAGESDIHRRRRVPHHPFVRADAMALFAELLAVGIDADARGSDAAAFATQCEGGADDSERFRGSHAELSPESHRTACPVSFLRLRHVNQWRRIAMSSRVRPRLESCSSSRFLSHARMRCFPGSS